MTRPRVFITGAGVASPLGTGKQCFFAGLREAIGRHPDRPVVRVDLAAFLRSAAFLKCPMQPRSSEWGPKASLPVESRRECAHAPRLLE